jgi:predicted house-cleaning noncanonical NTP pyrophosphatase (MazG superfamily)
MVNGLWELLPCTFEVISKYQKAMGMSKEELATARQQQSL